MVEKILTRWLAGKITAEQIDLLVKCGYLTYEQGEEIKATRKDVVFPESP